MKIRMDTGLRLCRKSVCYKTVAVSGSGFFREWYERRKVEIDNSIKKLYNKKLDSLENKEVMMNGKGTYRFKTD